MNSTADAAASAPTASTNTLVKVTRALISVSDKDGIVDLAQALHDLGVEIVSTGGTSKAIKDAGIPVVSIDETPIGDGRPGPITRRLRAAYLAAIGGGDGEGAP